MSDLSSVRPLFRTQLEGLGYEEHRDAFNFDNIGDSIINDSFHLETTSISSLPANQIAHDFAYNITLRVFKRGYNDPATLLDEIDQVAQDIYGALLDPAIRLGTDIKDIVPDGYQPLPYAPSNDNTMILEMNFTAKLLVCFA